jgi:hypothetical protein
MAPEVLSSPNNSHSQLRPSLRAKVVLLFLSLTVAGLLTEGAARAVAYIQTSRPSPTRSSERPIRHYPPEGSVTNRGNGNQSGYDSANFRIAVVGDSFTFAPHIHA